MTRLVVKIGGRVAEASVPQVLELAEENEVVVVHGAGPQISADMEAAGVEVRFVGGRRVTTEAGLAIVRASFGDVNAAVCAAIGERAVPLFGDEIGIQATLIPALGLVGDPLPSKPAAILEALREGKIPVVAPLGDGPLNVNADDAAAALAIGLRADELVFVTDVEGFLLDGEVVDTLDLETAEGLVTGGTLDPTILPKLGAAMNAARHGIAATIGRTVVTA